MKKIGFTLAEVLVTLAIIGVVATMTLPALMTNTQEQQAKTGLKKGINTLTEAAQTNQAIDGFDYAGLREESGAVSDDDVETQQSMTGLLVNRTQIDYRASNNGGSGDANLVDATVANYVVFFRDGSAVSYPRAAQANIAEANAIEPDGLAHGFGVVYDYNGVKKPNLLSNCHGNTTMTADSFVSDEDRECSKANRVIKDQFGIRLRGPFAFPNGAAARWAFEN